MMKKRTAAFILSLVLCLSLIAVPTAVYADGGFDLDFGTCAKTEFFTALDGNDLKIALYEDVYVTNPTAVAGSNGYAYDGTNYVDQGISIYVPETATKDSAIYFIVNNSGWQADAYASRNMVYEKGQMVRRGMGPNATQAPFEGYSSTADNIGAALARGMVVVSYGCRSRNDKPDADGNYVSHSPATMTDTKAVIRYLRANAAKLPAGDPEKIVITGTSGGGALSVVIAASGNSADYYESLYEIGAAGIAKNGDSYTSSIGDDVLGTIAYCPINDLRQADQAYEFTYSEVRKTLVAEGFEWKFNGESVNDTVMAASPVLAAAYPEYVKTLGIGLDDAAAIEAAIIKLINAELAESVKEYGLDSMLADLAGTGPNGSTTSKFNSGSEGWVDWWTITDGVPQITSHEQYVTYLTFVAKNQDLKAAPAFSNLGMNIAGQNEDSLLGTKEYPYSPYEFYSWDNDATAGNGAGKDDTGLTWDEFMKTEAGAFLALQNKMASPIDYLTVDKANADSAPYWYVRHGLRDRDTSFALQTVLYHSMLVNDDIDQAKLDFELAWLKGHAGNYDVPEAFAWLDKTFGTSVVFLDIPGDYWGKEAIDFVAEQGLMSGTGGNMFAPAMPTSRAMVATVLHRIEGRPAATASGAFTDVAAGTWYSDAVDWAAEKGIVQGYDGVFRPEDPITREQFVTMLWRLKGQPAAAETDTGASDWAKDAMSWAVSVGLIVGTGGSYNPTGTASRAEAATILMRYVRL